MNQDQREIVNQALEILEVEFNKRGTAFTDPGVTREYLVLRFSEYEYEVFGVLFLDNQHCLIELDVMFRGTIDGAAVHPREVIRKALMVNAAAMIFFHNHPSGVAEPSQADQRITNRLKDAASLVEIRVLDHLIVGGVEVYSFAEHGLL